MVGVGVRRPLWRWKSAARVRTRRVIRVPFAGCREAARGSWLRGRRRASPPNQSQKIPAPCARRAARTLTLQEGATVLSSNDGAPRITIKHKMQGGPSTVCFLLRRVTLSLQSARERARNVLGSEEAGGAWPISVNWEFQVGHSQKTAPNQTRLTVAEAAVSTIPVGPAVRLVRSSEAIASI